jgi:hypothetical protein
MKNNNNASYHNHHNHQKINSHSELQQFMNDFDNNKVEVDGSINPNGGRPVGGGGGVNKPKMVVKGDQSKYVKKKPS